MISIFISEANEQVLSQASAVSASQRAVLFFPQSDFYLS